MLEVSLRVSLVEEQQVSRAGALDQSVVINRTDPGVLEFRQSSSGVVRILDLQGSVRLDPFRVGGLVGSFVGFGQRSKSLLSIVSKYRRSHEAKQLESIPLSLPH